LLTAKMGPVLPSCHMYFTVQCDAYIVIELGVFILISSVLDTTL
jgi:hypothetical protein